VFPHSFELHYTVELKGDEMNTVFLVKNCGSDAFDWTGALHTYFNVAAIDSTSVKGVPLSLSSRDATISSLRETPS
jgi:glucose-6-phosphate 1-epimerase